MTAFKLSRGGIFLKLFLGIWTAIIAVCLCVWVISINYQHVPSNYGYVDNSRHAKRMVMSAASVLHWGGEEALTTWLANKNINHRPTVFVIDESGREISGRDVPEKALAQIAANDQNAYFHTISYGMAGFHARHSRRLHGTSANRSLTFFAVRTELPPKNIWSTLWLTPIWVHITLAVIATTLVSMLLAWGFARPIRKLDWAMSKAAEGDLNVRIAKSVGNGYDEIGALAKRYDTMIERINGLLVRQKRLFHDVSHELRSPLARMDVAVAIAQRNPERSAEMLARMEKEVAVLDGLVGELLTYARLDDNSPLEMEKANLADVVSEVAANAEFEGSEKHVAVAVRTSHETIPVMINIDSVYHALENLIRNALRFSPENSEITVSLEKSGQSCTVSISDCGPGIPDDELENIFAPFVRGKSQATGSGFGLGLAIAKRSIERHGGSISAQNVKPHGLKISITLPLEG